MDASFGSVVEPHLLIGTVIIDDHYLLTEA